MKIYIIQNL